MSNQQIELVVTNEELEGKKLVAYPYCVIKFDIGLPVGHKGTRILSSYATVDLIKKTINRADSIPETATILLDESSILPAVVPFEEAMRSAQRKTMFWAFRRYRQIIAPRIDPIEWKIVYHPFFVAKSNGKTVLYNAVERSVDKWSS